MGSLGKLHYGKGDMERAQPYLKEALEGEVSKDAFQIDDTFTLVNIIKDLHTKPGPSGRPPTLPDLHKAYSQYVDILDNAVKRTQEFLKGPKAGDVAALYKTIGEIFLLAGHNEKAIPILSLAITIFQGVTQIDCSGLIDGCNQLLMLAQQLAAQQSDGSHARPTK